MEWADSIERDYRMVMMNHEPSYRWLRETAWVSRGGRDFVHRIHDDYTERINTAIDEMTDDLARMLAREMIGYIGIAPFESFADGFLDDEGIRYCEECDDAYEPDDDETGMCETCREDITPSAS